MTSLLDYFGGGDKRTSNTDTITETRDISGIRNLRAPTAQELMVQLQRAVLQGQITPQEAETILLEKSQLEGVKFDPKLQEAQYQALAQIQALANADGGFTPQTMAAINNIYDDLSQRSRSAQQGIIEQAEAQGAGQSGLKFALQQQANQNAVQNANRFYSNAAADQEEQRIKAISDAANLAQGISDRDLDLQKSKAIAQDEINRLNTQFRNDNQRFNINNDLDAQRENLRNRQDVENRNVGIANDQTVLNRDAKNQAYQNELARRREIANANVTRTSSGRSRTSGDKGQGVGNILNTAAGIYDLFRK